MKGCLALSALTALVVSSACGDSNGSSERGDGTSGDAARGGVHDGGGGEGGSPAGGAGGNTDSGTAGTSAQAGSPAGTGGVPADAATGGDAGTAGADAGADAGGTSDAAEAGEPPLPPALDWSAEGPLRNVEDIWGSGPDDIYAVGRTGALLHSSGDGTWTTLDAGTGANLTGVWGSASDDVFVTVDANVILHWTGSGAWQRDVLDTGYTFTGIWGSGPGDVYALGPGVMHHNGTGWQRPPQSVASGGVPRAIWGSSPTDVYITCGGACSRKIFHSAGDGSWSGQEAPEDVASADAVWGVDESHIYVGADNHILFSTGDGNWTIQMTAPGAGRITAGWAASAEAVYACTQDGFFYRSNGRGTWSEGQQIDPSGSGGCFAMWGTGPDNIYIGDRGIYRGTPAQ